MMQMLAERDRRAGEPTARERLYRYPTWVGVADSTMTPKALLEEVEEFASKRRLPASKLHELLVDSDDVLSRKLEEAQRTLDESSVQQKKPNALVRLCRMLVHKGAFAMYAGFACVAAPGLWRIVTLSETPLALQTLAILGVTLWVTVVAAGFVWAHNMPEEDTPAASRVSELTVLDNGECWDMLQYLRESPSARAWHHHVTHTQMRRFRQIDLKLLEALIVFERVRVEVAST
jgi:hypothetical protein